MKNTKYLLLMPVLVLSGIRMQAQQFFFSSEKPGSCSSADGIITIVPTQGVPPFTYQWNTGATEVSLKNATKGVYSVTLTDATGASVVHSHILNSKELDLYLSDYKPSAYCNPVSGALTIDVIGGTAPFTYTWSNGQTGATAQGLTTGAYSVTVQDAAGCEASGEFEVYSPPAFYYPNVAIQTLQEPDCINTSAGELSATLNQSGYLPYSYIWNNGATSQSITSLAGGTYSVTVTDGLGCTASTAIILQKALTVTGSVICNGSMTGTLSAQLVNAAPPVNYSWSNGQTGPNQINLGNGNYYVTATDVNGCSSTSQASVAVPELMVSDYSSKCYAGNQGTGYCWVNYDSPTSILWDDGGTEAWNYTLSPGSHSVTVTTSLGCAIANSVLIAAPLAPPMTMTYTANPADCTNGTGGALNVSITGGLPPYGFYAYGSNGFSDNDISALQNLQGGQYYMYAYSISAGNCNAFATADVPDISGFNPSLVIEKLDCTTGYGSAAVMNVTTPGAQYNWSTGSMTPDVYNLTAGAYYVTVTAGGSCVKYYTIDMFNNDSLQNNNSCTGLATGTLINDIGMAGCSGTAGIPFQLIRTEPSGALNFTDENGVFGIAAPSGTFDIKPANYNPADIACPPGGSYSINATPGSIITGLDFHFYNNNPADHRVRQKALRTAQPGYPYSMRFEVCNDGNSANNGTMAVEYGNFFGSIAATSFAQHTGAFSLVNETSGVPDNTTNFNFPGIAPGGCELLQVDFVTPPATPANTEFITRATVSPSSGDPTPDNNISTLFNTVVGSFDPNAVLSFPARNGNPHDGGDILQNEDRKITYQIFFQNTGNAPANLVMIRDTIDHKLNLASIRNITASHDMKVSVEGDNDVLVFKFPNINLPDSTSDFANSIGSVQYEIDLAPGLSAGTEIAKQAAIYFDFNAPVITNNNVLRIVNATSTQTPGASGNSIIVFPNPASQYFGFHTDTNCEMSVFNALGALVDKQTVESGLHQFSTNDLPDGIYMLRLESNGRIRNGKIVVSH